MNLPSPIQAYFAADAQSDDKAVVETFAADAIVKDEGHTIVGRGAIGAWWRRAKDQYQAAIEPLEVDDKDDITTVRAKVTGQFPGSPAMLSFVFRLSGVRISHLEIHT